MLVALVAACSTVPDPNKRLMDVSRAPDSEMLICGEVRGEWHCIDWVEFMAIYETTRDESAPDSEIKKSPPDESELPAELDL